MGSSGAEAPSMRKKNNGNLLGGALVLLRKHGSQTPRPPSDQRPWCLVVNFEALGPPKLRPGL